MSESSKSRASSDPGPARSSAEAREEYVSTEDRAHKDVEGERSSLRGLDWCGRLRAGEDCEGPELSRTGDECESVVVGGAGRDLEVCGGLRGTEASAGGREPRSCVEDGPVLAEL